MEAAAVVIPIPVQPIQPQQPTPGAEAPAEGEEGAHDFASALEQQIAQAAATGGNAAQLKVAVPDDAASDNDHPQDAATPDSLIAMMTVPLFPPQQPAAPVAASSIVPDPPDAVTGAKVDGATRAGHAIASELHAGAQNAKPFEFRAKEEHGSAHAAPGEAPIAPSPVRVDAADTAAAALLHAAAPSPAHAAPVHQAAHADPHIEARVGAAAWNDGLAQQVTVMVKDGEHTAQLRLDPPDLGPLEVRLSMARNDEAIAHAQFVSPHASVRDAVETALPQLRAILADNGITLGQASVGEGFVRDDGRGSQQPRGGARSAGANEPVGGVTAPRTMVRHGLVDTFA
ncbi:MAG: flagellar hook-length control protein FliK [Rhodospirillaceae bacterium]